MKEIKYFCNKCEKELIDYGRINGNFVEFKEKGYFSGINETFRCFDLCNDCLKKVEFALGIIKE